ncbi:MAG TPA: DNA polymerase domain-containing protein [Nitrososphaeraceae archaeon]|nr:DNA polymerase domain-containing protein [Nitrososphaeraceae archaeon]
MAIQTATGWLLDVSHDFNTGEINLYIRSQDDKVISFKQKLKEYIFYILPKSHRAGDDLYLQLSRNDEVIKKIFWDKKYIDLSNRNETRLIGISVTDMNSQDFQAFIKKLRVDLRVRSLYNVELTATQYFIYNKLKIPPTSKVIIKYEKEKLLFVEKVEDSQDAMLPPFKLMHIRISSGSEPKLNVRFDNQIPVIFNGPSDESFGSYINENKPDIAIVYAEYRQDRSILTSVRNVITEQSSRTVVVRTRYTIEDISLVEMVEKARFSYLSLQLASTYGMLKLIDSRVTYELIRRNFVIPKLNTVSKHHEEIRTLENIIEMDKAGMIISPQVGLHDNVAVLDFNDEYANIITGHNISYECSSNEFRSDERTTILPSIVQELVTKRVYLKQLLRTQQPDSRQHVNCEARLDILKQILVCLYGTSGSIWNRYSNVNVFEEINRRARQILLKTKDIVQEAGFDLIYADTDAVFLKKKHATRQDFEEIKNVIAKETRLDLTLEFHYKFLVLLYIEADEKMEAKKHYFGLTYDNQLITRGIETRRHDSPIFIKEFQKTLLSKLFDCQSSEEVLTTGYQNALEYITQNINKLMNGEVQITDLVISKLLRQNIKKYRSLFPHVAAAIRLNVSGVIANRGDDIQYVYTDSNHSDPLYTVTPAKLISSKDYDREKYLEMLLDSAEAVLSIFGFSRSFLGFEKKFKHWWDELYQQREREIESIKMES